MRRLFLSLAIVPIAAIAFAHTGATGVVKQRMDHMGGIGKAMKEIARMLQGETEWAPDRLRTLAQAIGAAGGDAMTAHFPEGSIHGPSEARPEIWRDWGRFTDLAAELSETAAILAAAADRPRDNAEGSPDLAFREVARTCKECHQHFRIKK